MKMFKISTQMGGIFQFSKSYRKELCHEKGLKTHIIFCNMNREVSSVSLNRKFSSALTLTLRTPKISQSSSCCCPRLVVYCGNAYSVFDFKIPL